MNIFKQALILNSKNSYIKDINHKRSDFYNLNVDFLKKNNYGVKNIFDSIDKNDINYFINVLNYPSEFYLYSSINMDQIEIMKCQTIKEMEDNFFNMFPKMTILDFSGSKIYIYMQDTIYYQIFGEKEKLKLIKNYPYSDEKAKIDLTYLNKMGTTYFQWLYDTYQHL